MKLTRVSRSLFAAAGFSVLLCGQTSIDLRTQTRNIDFSAAAFTKPVKVGTTLPAVCSVGDLFYRSDAPAGQNLYGCTATNVWTVLSSGGAAWGGIVGTLSSQTDLQAALDAKETTANKNTAWGYAGLAADGKLTLSQGQELWSLTDLSDVASKRGNTTQVQMSAGSFSPDDCAKFDASGNLVSAGGPCGTGGGGSVLGGIGVYITSNNTVNVDPTVFSTLTATASIDFGSIAAQACSYSDISLPGAAVGDTAMVGTPSGLADGLFASARVSVADTLRLGVCNLSGAIQDPPNLTFRVTVTKPF